MAKQMIRRSQTVFLIETMQFNWFGKEIKLNWLNRTMTKFIQKLNNTNYSYIILLVIAIIGGLFFGILMSVWPETMKDAIRNTIFVVITLFIYKVFIDLFSLTGWPFWIALWATLIILGNTIHIIFDEKIEPVEKVKLHTKWKIIKIRDFINDEKFRELLRFEMYIGITTIGTLSVGLVYFFAKKGQFNIIYLVVFSLKIYPFAILSQYISQCLECRLMTVQVDVSLSPNQGIKKSAINFMIFGIPAVILMSIIYVYIQNIEVISSNPVLAYLIGLAISIGLAFDYGGKACLQHFVLRLFLCITGSIPWNYAKFLDWASDKLFLQKVGGGYIFIHRSLMEHFAEMENTL
jgi:hypothetical protein